MGKGKKRGSVPAFMRQKSYTTQAQRRVIATKQRAEENRQEVGQVMTYCVLIALHDLYHVGPKRQDDFGVLVGKEADVYEAEKRLLGKAAARSRLHAQVADALGDWQLPTMSKEYDGRDRYYIRHQQDSGLLTMEILLTSLKNGWGYGEKRLRAVLEEADRNYRQFLQWAEDGAGDGEESSAAGQYYAFCKLAEVVKQIYGNEDIYVNEQPEIKPVFAKRL